MRKNHKKCTELDSTIRVSRHEHLLIKGIHPGPSPADLIYGDFVELCVQLGDVDFARLVPGHTVQRQGCRTMQWIVDLALFHECADREVPIVHPHLEHAGQLSQEARESFLGNVSSPDRVKLGPSLLEAPNFLSADNREPTASLVDVREILVDQRDEQVDEDVHAQNVPRDEESARPLLAAAVAIEVAFADGTVRWFDPCEVFHDCVPAFTHTRSK